jgi:uncharacterized SAM-dependent methyltransferase
LTPLASVIARFGILLSLGSRCTSRACKSQHVSIEHADLDVHFMRRETIHTENSYKFTDRSIRTLLGGVGFEIRGAWKDCRGWYTLTLACVE